ncbi:hypothetical protein P691DRAFT_307285 [Macrolepiota fuliginosa MF-IS2]|uniref:Uncharacterized protein n=1 Tax=Macrolepiota fuliginosa MF-IS2 TaxID=1400762 RepID=A0A9P5X4N5_9AGAR|nr:hypothetical protein P691DRAFT_307285 [Macrolepiota fuliginosa MF-IS2]
MGYSSYEQRAQCCFSCARAAALRITGSTVPDGVSPSKPRTLLTKERLAQTFANVPVCRDDCGSVYCSSNNRPKKLHRGSRRIRQRMVADRDPWHLG